MRGGFPYSGRGCLSKHRRRVNRYNATVALGDKRGSAKQAKESVTEGAFPPSSKDDAGRDRIAHYAAGRGKPPTHCVARCGPSHRRKTKAQPEMARTHGMRRYSNCACRLGTLKKRGEKHSLTDYATKTQGRRIVRRTTSSRKTNHDRIVMLRLNLRSDALKNILGIIK